MENRPKRGVIHTVIVYGTLPNIPVRLGTVSIPSEHPGEVRYGLNTLPTIPVRSGTVSVPYRTFPVRFGTVSIPYPTLR